MNPERLTEQLRDIRGLDQVPWWPPGPGWWLILIVVPLLLWALARWAPPSLGAFRVASRPFWQRAAARRLRELRRRVGKEDLKTVAGELSELLRRIAMARCGRDTCAGLSGRAWLAWLKHHDPLGFDWEKHGSLLTHAPYAPPGDHGNAAVLQTLIDAALAWTHPGQAAACPARDVARGV